MSIQSANRDSRLAERHVGIMQPQEVKDVIARHMYA